MFKTLGSEDDKSLSYVSASPADLCAWIERQQARGLNLSGPCMLQEKIDMVAELGVSGWFGPEGFLPEKWQPCWEHKKLCNGEIGPNTGEMGTVCQYVEDDPHGRRDAAADGARPAGARPSGRLRYRVRDRQGGQGLAVRVHRPPGVAGVLYPDRIPQGRLRPVDAGPDEGQGHA